MKFMFVLYINLFQKKKHKCVFVHRSHLFLLCINLFFKKKETTTFTANILLFCKKEPLYNIL